MGTILASVLIDKAEVILRDTGNAQYSAANLLDFLNEGQREIVKVKNDENVVATAVQLAAGARQSMPAGSLQLIDIPVNLGTSGTTTGNAITYVKKRDMDLERPSWQADTASATVYHYTFDSDDSGAFYVWPPQPSSSPGYVRIVRSAIPADIASGDPITVSDAMEATLINYILYKAYSVDSTSPTHGTKSGSYHSLFLQSLGISEQVEEKADPSGRSLREVSEP